MNINAFKNSILTSTNELLYISESENPWVLEDLDNKTEEEIQQWISSLHNGEPAIEVNPDDFFDRYITSQKMSGDEVMIADADRYEQLYQLLKSSSNKIQVWRCGKIQVGVYVVIITEDGQSLVLKTTSIET